MSTITEIFGWTCSTIMVLAVISGIVYYNLEADRAIIAYIAENNLNPMILECMNKNWTTVDTYEICKIVSSNPKISEDELRGALN